MKIALHRRLLIALPLLFAAACSSESDKEAERPMETGEVVVMDENGVPALASNSGQLAAKQGGEQSADAVPPPADDPKEDGSTDAGQAR